MRKRSDSPKIIAKTVDDSQLTIVSAHHFEVVTAGGERLETTDGGYTWRPKQEQKGGGA